MKIYNSESAIRPDEWDKTSSPDCVYHNENIVEVQPTEEGDPVMYRYNVTEYTNKEYINLVTEKQSSDISDINDALIELAEIIGG